MNDHIINNDVTVEEKQSHINAASLTTEGN